MSYIANQYNYATPLSSVAGLTNEVSVVDDAKYFTLSDNILDGSYRLISGDVGLWGSTLSGADGSLSAPFVVTVTESLVMNAFRLISSQYCFPVDFTVDLYNGTMLLHTITETGNNSAEYMHPLYRVFHVTSYVLTITKISKANQPVRIYNLHDPDYVRRADSLKVLSRDASTVSAGLYITSSDTAKVKSTYTANSEGIVALLIHSADTLKAKETSKSTGVISALAVDVIKGRTSENHYVHNTINLTNDTVKVKQLNSTHIMNTIDVTKDTLRHKVIEDTSHVINIFDPVHDRLLAKHIEGHTLTNVHTRMKDPSRKIYGKVYITYTDPMLENETTIESNMEAYHSTKEQVMDGVLTNNERLFTLYDNNLSGAYNLISEQSQVGWVSGSTSDANGNFTDVPYLKVSFSARPITPVTVYFDDSHGSVAKDFYVDFIHSDGTITRKNFVGNTSNQVLINDEVIINVEALVIYVTKVSKPNFPVSILELPVMSTLLYKGYKEHSDLMSIDLLEELTYEDEVEALGGVSANEVTVVIDNSDSMFYFNNNSSAVSKQLRRNRRIEPWLGTEIIPGEIEWYKLGTYWSYSWKVPVSGLTATVVGFDTLGLLDTTSFTNHAVYIDKTLGELIEYILEDAKSILNFVNWKIDDALYDVVIPYAWFAAASHTAALRKVSQAYPMHIYCDRDGTICAAPQKLQLDYYYDTWSDSTNVISKEYSSLYTTLPNIVNVTVNIPKLIQGDNLVQDNLQFSVASVPTRTLNFSKPYLSDIVVTIDKDSTVNYTYSVYSWGIIFNFTGSGNVRSITCVGTAVDISNSSTLTRRNEDSIRTDGAVTRDVSADFIQTSDLAALIIDRIFTLSVYDKYDATISYRGDIALTINDPIRLLNGIAPDNRYNIRRHQLSWNGALSGTADLNT